MTAPAAAAGAPHSWGVQRERGSRWLIATMIWLSRHLGWHVGHVLLYPITLWFYCSAAGARAASRDYLSRVLGRPPTQRDVLRHLFTFACVILDRVFFLSDRARSFTVRAEGLSQVTDILNSGRGCILLGSHLGSFDVLRAVGRMAPVRVSPVMFRRDGGHLTRLLEALDPELARDVIEIGRPDALLRVYESIERGEVVGLLADRAAGRPRGQGTLAIRFLGDAAEFPTAPLILASVLAAPVLLAYGIRVGRRRYVVRFERFADRIVLPRDRRGPALRAWLEAYGDSLAAACREHPFNWFNFFPFWGDPTHAGR